MTALAERPVFHVTPVTVTPKRPRSRRAVPVENLTLFLATWIGLFALGVWILRRHVIYGDALSRLTHTYMVYWNTPAKLAAMGFVWPPLQTMALLPFALIKPLATSLVALPLFSSLCAAVLVTTLNRSLTLLKLRWGWRYSLLGVFVLNPMFLDYATNGMAEVQFMALMALGLHYMLSWYLDGGTSYRRLAVSGLFMALAFMTRYELGAWIALMTLTIAVTTFRRTRRYADVEGAVLVFLAPSIYLLVIWSLLSIELVGGGPMSWLTRASDQSQGYAVTNPTVPRIAGDVISMTTHMGPALWLVPAGLLVVAIKRRDGFALSLASMVLIGALTTFVLVVASPFTGLLQPRYNIRALAPMVLGAGYLIQAVDHRWLRVATAATLLAALAATIPLATDTMRHFPYQYEEQAFMRALTTGHDQNGTLSVDGPTGRYTIGTIQDQRFANWVNAHVHTHKTVLVDDGSFPGSVLLSGRPDLFVTRIDHGDAAWMKILNEPWGNVRYMIAENSAFTSAGFSIDKVSSHWPGAYEGTMPGTHVVFRMKTAALVEVNREEPIPYLLGSAALKASRHNLARLTATARRRFSS